jgi:hypothetical protein
MKKHQIRTFFLAAFFLSCSNPAEYDTNKARRESSPLCNFTWVYHSSQRTYYNNDSTRYFGSTTITSYSFTPDAVLMKDFYHFGEHCPKPDTTCDTIYTADSVIIFCRASPPCYGIWGGHSDSSVGSWNIFSDTLFMTFHDTIHDSLPYRFSSNEDTLFLKQYGEERQYIKTGN